MGPRCHERITKEHKECGSWERLALALGINRHTLYRAYRHDKGVGLETAMKLMAALGLKTIEEVFQ